MKIVGIINAAPPNPKTKFELTLSKLRETRTAVAVKRGIAHMINLWSDLTKGSIRKNTPIGIIKNWLPPHADMDKGIVIPADINFTIAIFLFLELIPLSKKYSAKIPKNNPRGSDLNQPIVPLYINGNETEKNNAENNPAVVPPSTLTNAKITIVLREPIITGKRIVKS